MSLTRRLGCRLALAALGAWLAACAPAYGVHVAASASCSADAECPSGFCDSGSCATAEGLWGAACVAAPRTPEGIRDAKLHSCGPYLCANARCRSCTSDEQCRNELGAPRCVSVAGLPGRRCGR